MRLVAVSVAFLLSATGQSAAQRLPLQCYGAREGLPSIRIEALLEDSRGFLWIGTTDGVARFDGQRFTTFTRRDGLGHTLISDFLEEGSGRLWVATYGGVSLAREGRSTSRSDRAFANWSVVSSDPGVNQISQLARVGDELWAAGSGGILHGRVDRGGLHDLVLAEPRILGMASRLTVVALHGTGIVYGGDGELIIRDGGTTRHHLIPGANRATAVVAITGDGDDFLVLTETALYTAHLPPGGGAQFTQLPFHFGPGDQPFAVLRRRDRTIWLGTRKGLLRYDGRTVSRFDTRQGLPDPQVRALAEDRAGGLWIGTFAAGLCHLSGESIVNYGPSEGLEAMHVDGLLEAQDRTIYAGSFEGPVSMVSGDRAEPVPGAERPELIGAGRRIMQDTKGDFWIGSDQGVYFAHGPRLDLRRAQRLSGKAGLPEDWPPDTRSNFILDAEHRLWSAFIAHSPYRSDPALQHFAPVAALPGGETGVRALAIVRPDLIWFTTYWRFGRLARGAVQMLTSAAGELDSRPVSIFRDAEGSVWIGYRHSGVVEVLDPAAAVPHYRRWSTANGLINNAVWEIAEDRAGHILLATEGGLHVLDRNLGVRRVFTAVDGLPSDMVSTVLVDHAERVWVGTGLGLSRIDHLTIAPSKPPAPVLFTGLEVGGQALPISARGLAESLEVELHRESSSLAIEFTSPSLGGRVRYQHRLQPTDDRWSPPTPETTLRFARIDEGRYALSLRAVDEAGRPGPPSRELLILVHPPFWQTRWFQLVLLGSVALVALAVQRLRNQRVLAVERLRRQIAADLHDDVGSGLSNIAILSEVARQAESSTTPARLGEIAGTARELRAAMADIVWSIDPRRDRLVDLLRRLRETAYRLEVEGIEVSFEATEELESSRLPIAPDRKRTILLLFKEAIHNIAKHAQAQHVRIDLTVDGGRLRLRIHDDGQGFELTSSNEGLGLASMRQRARDLGGTLQVDSRPGGGTSLVLAMPLGRK